MRAVRFSGMIYDWGLLSPLGRLVGTRSALRPAAAALKAALE